MKHCFLKHFCILVLAAVWPIFITQASEDVSLPQMLKRARANEALNKDINSLMQQADEKLEQVQMEKWLTTFKLMAYGGVVPDVNADSAVRNKSADDLLFNIKSSDFENDFSFSKLGPFANVEVTAVQPIFTWGKISGYEGMSQGNRQIAEQDKRKELEQVRYMVKKAYYTLQFSTDALKILGDVKSKLKQAEQKVEELLIKNADNVEENDRLKIKVFLADVENRTLDATKGARLSRSALTELTGTVGDWAPVQNSLTAETVQGIQKNEVISQALRSQPDVKKLDDYINIKRSERATIKADLFPTFFLAGKLEYAIAPGRTDITNPYLNDPFNKFNLGVSFGLKQDLGFYRTLNKLDQLDSKLARLQAQRERFKSVMKLKTEDAFERAVAAQKGIGINEKGFRAARSWLTSTGLAFNLGTAQTKDVLESYAAYFKARVDLLKSVYELNMALTELSRAAGVELVQRLKQT